MEIERKPWFVGDQEKQGLTTVPATPASLKGVKSFGKDLQGEISSAVPQLKKVTRDSIVCEWGEKDGLINYHFYLPVRYSIRMEVEEQMEMARKECSKDQLPIMQQRIADQANAELAKSPWPEGMESRITDAKLAVFPYGDCKVSFFPEVDSYSLVMPKPVKGFVDDFRYESVITRVDQYLSGG